MADVVFVHGTGVREPGFTESLARIRTALKKKLPDARVHPCYWGERHGSALRDGRSIPLYEPAQLGVADRRRDETTDWTLLLDDPLIELRLVLTYRESRTREPPPFGRNLPKVLRGQLATLRAAVESDFERDLLAGRRDEFLAAIDALTQWTDLDAAIEIGATLDLRGAERLDSARLLVSRAIVADWLARLTRQWRAVPSGDEREALVSACIAALGGGKTQTMSLAGDAIRALLAPVRKLAHAAIVDPALHAATWGSRVYRNSVFDLTTPAVGDILVYQSRGHAIRECIRECVESVGKPVVLLAHSLGGIACVDLLIERAPACVKGLITAGSQAPYLYEIGALSQLGPGGPLPGHVPPWLNFFDRNDLLSFKAAPVFLGDGGNGIDDVETPSGQPFPAAHGAYWSSDALWERAAHFVRTHLP